MAGETPIKVKISETPLEPTKYEKQPAYKILDILDCYQQNGTSKVMMRDNCPRINLI